MKSLVSADLWPQRQVTLVLRDGDVTVGVRTWDSGDGRNRTVVGSGDDCGWIVRRGAADSRHLELLWDGRTLWAAPVPGSEVHIDKRRCRDWQPITRACTIRLGTLTLSATPRDLLCAC